MRLRRRERGTREDQSETPGPDEPEPAPSVEGVRAQGPWDVTEQPVDEDDETRVHLGALSVKGHPGMELRLQVDEGSGQVQSVLLVAQDGALELRAFAAPRHEDLWDDIRPRLAEEAVRRGGAAEEVEGPFGPALRLAVPATAPDGTQVTQPSTVVGIPGPRWLLRVSMFGRPATDYRQDGLLEQALRDVVVIRGNQPMAPGENIPLVLPTGARRLDPGRGPEAPGEAARQ
jgi:hypothetical protein